MTNQPYQQPAAPEIIAPAEKPRKKKRIFMWFFLVVQLLFLIAVIAGISSGGDTSNCGSLSQADCEAAGQIGTGIGVALIFVAWAIVDVILGIGYIVVKLARR